jgi:large subunit ribosomal protein L21
MFAVVRTGGKQYRVAPGDKIVVERLDGNAGDQVTLGEVLLAGDGGDLKSTAGLTVAAEIIAQAKGDKVTVFKKRRRHNYRRKKGHRQLHTILRIVAIGDHKHVPSKVEGEQKKAAPKMQGKSAPPIAPAPTGEGSQKPAAHAKAKTEVEVDQQKSSDVTGTPTPNPAPDNEAAAKGNEPEPSAPTKPAPKKAAAAKPRTETPSTKNAAPAKAAAKKTPKAK